APRRCAEGADRLPTAAADDARDAGATTGARTMMGSPVPPTSHTRAALDATDWSLVDASDAAATRGADSATGLSAAEATARRERFGANELDAAPPEPAWRRLLRQFADPLIYLLLGAVVISTIAWLFEGAHGVPVDAIVIIAIVIANAIL